MTSHGAISPRLSAQPTPVAPAATTDADEAALVRRCQAGDQTAFRLLFDRHFDFVYRTVRRLGTPDAEADDAAQETFWVAWRKLEGFAEGRLSTWLYRIAANVVSGRHRRRRVREAVLGLLGRAGEPPPPPGPDAALEGRDAQTAVAKVLARMAPKKREVFALFELEGLSGEEIAERVGCPVDTVWTRLFHARKDFERLARKQGLSP